MPKLIPIEIKSDSIAIYGRMIGIKKLQYRIPMLQTVDIYPTEMGLYEQVLIGDSILFSETPSKVEVPLLGVGMMLSETPSRVEDIIITNT